jgi:hypothetical protein
LQISCLSLSSDAVGEGKTVWLAVIIVIHAKSKQIRQSVSPRLNEISNQRQQSSATVSLRFEIRGYHPENPDPASISSVDIKRKKIDCEKSSDAELSTQKISKFSQIWTYRDLIANFPESLKRID